MRGALKVVADVSSGPGSAIRRRSLISLTHNLFICRTRTVIVTFWNIPGHLSYSTISTLSVTGPQLSLEEHTFHPQGTWLHRVTLPPALGRGRGRCPWTFRPLCNHWPWELFQGHDMHVTRAGPMRLSLKIF